MKSIPVAKEVGMIVSFMNSRVGNTFILVCFWLTITKSTACHNKKGSCPLSPNKKEEGVQNKESESFSSLYI